MTLFQVVAFVSTFLDLGFGQKLCAWSNRLLPNGATGNFTVQVPIYFLYQNGYLNEEPFSTYFWARGWCSYKRGYFRCPYEKKQDFYATRLTLPNIQDLSYVMLRDWYPITLHRPEDETVPGFYVDKDTQLDVCPQYSTVNLRWYFNGNEADLQNVSCYQLGMRTCSGLQPFEKRENGKCRFRNVKGKISIGFMFAKPTTRLGFYYCYLDSEKTKALTYIVDWKDVTKTRDAPIGSDFAERRSIQEARTSGAKLVLGDTALLWWSLILPIYLADLQTRQGTQKLPK
ncbi:hypothetical protein SprV_0602081900 [Sparganum proliferum]